MIITATAMPEQLFLYRPQFSVPLSLRVGSTLSGKRSAFLAEVRTSNANKSRPRPQAIPSSHLVCCQKASYTPKWIKLYSGPASAPSAQFTSVGHNAHGLSEHKSLHRALEGSNLSASPTVSKHSDENIFLFCDLDPNTSQNLNRQNTSTSIFQKHCSSHELNYYVNYLDHMNIFYVGEIQQSESHLTYKYGITYRLSNRINAHKRNFTYFSPKILVACNSNRQVETKVKRLMQSLSRAVIIKNNTELFQVDQYRASNSMTQTDLLQLYTFSDFVSDLIQITRDESQKLDKQRQSLLNIWNPSDH